MCDRQLMTATIAYGTELSRKSILLLVLQGVLWLSLKLQVLVLEGSGA